MLAVWIATAFALGLLARQIGLPPLVGYLLAGFLLNALGVVHPPLLEEISELGVLLRRLTPPELRRGPIPALIRRLFLT